MPKTAATSPQSVRVTEPLWTPADVSDYFAGRITEKTLMNWRSSGDGPPYIKLGAANVSPVLYRPSAVKQWAIDQERKTREVA